MVDWGTLNNFWIDSDVRTLMSTRIWMILLFQGAMFKFNVKLWEGDPHQVAHLHPQQSMHRPPGGKDGVPGPIIMMAETTWFHPKFWLYGNITYHNINMMIMMNMHILHRPKRNDDNSHLAIPKGRKWKNKELMKASSGHSIRITEYSTYFFSPVKSAPAPIFLIM